jgi:predicted protein tyrosine phosphatase
VFSRWPDVEADSAGLGNDAEVALSTEQIAWANIIFVMEKAHRNRLSQKFRAHLNGKRVICLDIPDGLRLHAAGTGQVAGGEGREVPALR